MTEEQGTFPSAKSEIEYLRSKILEFETTLDSLQTTLEIERKRSDDLFTDLEMVEKRNEELINTTSILKQKISHANLENDKYWSILEVTNSELILKVKELEEQKARYEELQGEQASDEMEMWQHHPAMGGQQYGTNTVCKTVRNEEKYCPGNLTETKSLMPGSGREKDEASQKMEQKNNSELSAALHQKQTEARRARQVFHDLQQSFNNLKLLLETI
ncbi:uncharacterized protein LOC143465463 [Clavelina lepadiformis]|uniref:uncharacterized protein LOC143465463 n=1 Tax=Clavelina lepadiformis TaxID=159417 RepID=UPI0040437043